MKISQIEVTYIDHMGNDNSVANAARVSFDKLAENYTPEQNAKLIRYLAKHKHFSPFNHSFITLKVKAPVFVARQLVKHKFMPWNEISRRYVDNGPEFYWPDTWRKSAANVKQGSSDEPLAYMQERQWDGTDDEDCYNTVENLVRWDMYSLVRWYEDLIRNGLAPEQARMILPQNMMTEWYWSGTLGAYCDMLRLRLDPHTQKESRDVAQKALEIIQPLFPVAVPALLENN